MSLSPVFLLIHKGENRDQIFLINADSKRQLSTLSSTPNSPHYASVNAPFWCHCPEEGQDVLIVFRVSGLNQLTGIDEGQGSDLRHQILHYVLSKTSEQPYKEVPTKLYRDHCEAIGRLGSASALVVSNHGRVYQLIFHYDPTERKLSAFLVVFQETVVFDQGRLLTAKALKRQVLTHYRETMTEINAAFDVHSTAGLRLPRLD